MKLKSFIVFAILSSVVSIPTYATAEPPSAHTTECEHFGYEDQSVENLVADVGGGSENSNIVGVCPSGDVPHTCVVVWSYYGTTDAVTHALNQNGVDNSAVCVYLIGEDLYLCLGHLSGDTMYPRTCPGVPVAPPEPCRDPSTGQQKPPAQCVMDLVDTVLGLIPPPGPPNCVPYRDIMYCVFVYDPPLSDPWVCYGSGTNYDDLDGMCFRVDTSGGNLSVWRADFSKNGDDQSVSNEKRLA